MNQAFVLILSLFINIILIGIILKRRLLIKSLKNLTDIEIKRSYINYHENRILKNTIRTYIKIRRQESDIINKINVEDELIKFIKKNKLSLLKEDIYYNKFIMDKTDIKKVIDYELLFYQNDDVYGINKKQCKKIDMEILKRLLLN